jgi:hypothetical protein
VIPDTLVIYLTDLGAMNKSGKDAARESRVETKRRNSQELRSMEEGRLEICGPGSLSYPVFG